MTRSFRFGRATDTPVVGDWDGDGRSGLAVVRPDGERLRWALRATASPGAAHRAFTYGRAGDRPIAAPWSGSVAGIAVIRPDI